MSRISALVASTDDQQTEIVPIAAWKVEIELRGMNIVERSDYIHRLIDARENEDQDALNQLDAEIVVACAYDPEDGSKAFDEADIPMLVTKSGAVIFPLSLKAQRLSGLDSEVESRLGKGFSTSALTVVPAVVDLPSAASSSPSPENLG